MATITGKDIQAMVEHWLLTPVSGYLGSDYGQDAKSMLQRPFTDTGADAFIAKMKRDIPIVAALPEGSVNVYSVPVGIDKLRIVIEVAGNMIEVDV